MRGGDHLGVIVDAAKEIGILDDDQCGILVDQVCHRFRAGLQVCSRFTGQFQFHALCVGADNVAVLRMHGRRNDYLRAFAAELRPGQVDGFCGSGRAVVVGCVRHFHAGQRSHQTLILENGLECAL